MSGRCCKLFLVNLNKEEYESGRYKTMFDEFERLAFEKAEQSGAHFLKQKKDGSCIYLDGNKCSIHEIRPQVCRGFFCESKDPKFQEMIEIINIQSQ